MFNSISTAFSLSDESGHCYFGEQSDTSGSSVQIVPVSQFKLPISSK